MITIQQFKGLLENYGDDFGHYSYLLAVSGGVDSMVLAYLFKQSNLNFQIAHVNYHLREEDSNNDQKLVELFCLENDIKLHIYNVSEKDDQPEGSIQLWARNLRYQFFQKIMDTEKIETLVTAHHLNDQLETFLINLSRGSGIKGLSGISNNLKTMRPLLNFTKEEIYAFANDHKILFREDLSNKKNDYVRNKIRNTITPLLIDINPQFLNQFKQSIELLDGTKKFAFDQSEKIFNTISTQLDGMIVINKKLLEKESNFVQFYILGKFGFNNSDENEKIFNAQTGSQFQSSDYLMTINRNEIFIESILKQPSNNEEIITLEIASESDIIQIQDYIDEPFQEKEWKFDLSLITLPIQLRRKKTGDIFQPLGMKGKKKVSKFFKDEKISILAKEKIWLLVDGNDSILGVLPYRQDGRFAVKNNTNHTLTIRF